MKAEQMFTYNGQHSTNPSKVVFKDVTLLVKVITSCAQFLPGDHFDFAVFDIPSHELTLKPDIESYGYVATVSNDFYS